MAEQKILISIQINDKDAKKGADGAVKSLSKLERAQKELNYQLSEEAKELARVKAATQDQILANNLAAKSAVNMAKGVKQSRAQSGLNNAILLETSRLASDASYGFTAIANNLSQVINLFSSFTKTAGGVVNSFKQLGKSLLGSGGFLIAIQLLIAFGPQIFAFFERLLGFTREMREAFEGASKTISDSTGSFEIYVRTLQDTTKSQEEQNDAIKALNKEFPEYVKQLKDADLSLKDVAEQTKEATRITDEYREAILKQAMSRQAQIKIEESAANIIELQVEKEAKARDKGYDSLLAAQDRYNQLTNKKKEQELDYKEKAEFYHLGRLMKMNQDEIDEENDKIDRLLEFVDIENKERVKKGRSRERDFKQQLLNLEKLEESYRQKSIDQTLMTEDEKINAEEKFAKAELKIRLDQFNERQKLRLEEFKESDASAAEKAKAEKEYNESIVLAQQEHDDVMIQLKASYETKREQLERKRNERSAAETQKARDINREAEQQALEDLRTFDEEANTLYFEANSNFIQRLIERQQGIIDSEHATADQVAAARKEQFELQRQLRENDLNQEIAAIEAKKAVNLEYAGFAGQISDILSNVAGENEALAKAALVVEKGAAIAKVIITAQTSIAAKTASANAVPAFLPPFGTPNPAYIAAQVEAKKSNVRTKIGAALSIAQILSTMIGKKGGGVKDTGGSGGGGSRTIQAPDFNVVGASQTSQLAEVVSAQQAKPVKAFVVGKDISTQQELDRNITNTASFG
jgi:hypothetical protein